MNRCSSWSLRREPSLPGSMCCSELLLMLLCPPSGWSAFALWNSRSSTRSPTYRRLRGRIAMAPSPPCSPPHAGRIGARAAVPSTSPRILLRRCAVHPSGHRGQPSATRPERRLDLAETVDLLQRLGIATLGGTAASHSAAVADRSAPTSRPCTAGQAKSPPRPAHHPPNRSSRDQLGEPRWRASRRRPSFAGPLAEQLHTDAVANGWWAAPGCGSWPTRAAKRWSAPGGTTGRSPFGTLVDRIRW